MESMTGVEISYATLYEIEKGITYTKFKNEVKVDKSNMHEMNFARQQLNKGRPFYSIVNIAGIYGSVSKEAQVYWAHECECTDLIKFEAIIVTSLPVRIIVKNFIRQFKPKYEIKVFKNEKLALEAIQQKMKNED